MCCCPKKPPHTFSMQVIFSGPLESVSSFWIVTNKQYSLRPKEINVLFPETSQYILGLVGRQFFFEWERGDKIFI